MVMVKGEEMDFVSKEGNKAKTSPCKKGLEKRVKVSGMGIRVVGKVKKKKVWDEEEGGAGQQERTQKVEMRQCRNSLGVSLRACFWWDGGTLNDFFPWGTFWANAEEKRPRQGGTSRTVGATTGLKVPCCLSLVVLARGRLVHLFFYESRSLV